MALHGIIHGKTIELSESPGVRDGEAVTVIIERAAAVRSIGDSAAPPRVEDWVARLVFDSAVVPGERIVKGTTLSAEALVAEMSTGCSDREMMARYPELAAEDLTALR